MTATILSLLLAAQMLCQPVSQPPSLPVPCQETRLWWGMIDPELSLWFSRLPDAEETQPVIWDYSWRGLLAALFGWPEVMEVESDAAHA